jgi:Cu/Ag efflux pump CusA
MDIVIPITVMAIFLILYTMFRSFKWAMLILVSVVMASIGGPLALFITHTNFSVSSAVGFLALFGVSCADRRHHARVTSTSCALAARAWKSHP